MGVFRKYVIWNHLKREMKTNKQKILKRFTEERSNIPSNQIIYIKKASIFSLFPTKYWRQNTSIPLYIWNWTIDTMTWNNLGKIFSNKWYKNYVQKYPWIKNTHQKWCSSISKGKKNANARFQGFCSKNQLKKYN